MPNRLSPPGATLGRPGKLGFSCKVRACPVTGELAECGTWEPMVWSVCRVSDCRQLRAAVSESFSGRFPATWRLYTQRWTLNVVEVFQYWLRHLPKLCSCIRKMHIFHALKCCKYVHCLSAQDCVAAGVFFTKTVGRLDSW